MKLNRKNPLEEYEGKFTPLTEEMERKLLELSVTEFKALIDSLAQKGVFVSVSFSPSWVGSSQVGGPPNG